MEERGVNAVSFARNDTARAERLAVVQPMRLGRSLLRRSDFAQPTAHESFRVEDGVDVRDLVQRVRGGNVRNHRRHSSNDSVERKPAIGDRKCIFTRLAFIPRAPFTAGVLLPSVGPCRVKESRSVRSKWLFYSFLLQRLAKSH